MLGGVLIDQTENVLPDQQVGAENFQVFRGELWCCLSDCVFVVGWLVGWLVGWPSTVLNQTQIFRSWCYWIIPLETNQCNSRRSFFNSVYIFRHSNSQWLITIFTQSHHLTQSWATSVQRIFFQPISASSLNHASTYAIVLLGDLVP